MKEHKKNESNILEVFCLITVLQRSFSKVSYYLAKFYLWIREGILPGGKKKEPLFLFLIFLKKKISSLESAQL